MVSGRNENLSGRIRLGMVGGGNDAFIGGVHRIAARIDDKFELVAGALSSTPERSRASGEALGLARVYDDFKQMADLMTRKKLKKSINQFVKLEERKLDIDNEVRKIEEADEQNGNSVLDVLARLKKLR